MDTAYLLAYTRSLVGGPVQTSEQRGLSYFSLQHSERDHGFLLTIATNIFAIIPLHLKMILTIHCHQLMMVITRRPLSAFVINMGIAGVIISR